MSDIRHDTSLRIVKLLNLVMLTVPFVVCWYAYYAPRLYSPFFRRGNWAVIALYLVVYGTYGKVYDAFQISINRVEEIVYSQALAALVTDGIFYVITYLLTKFVPSPLPLMAAFLFQLVLAVVWASAAYAWYFHVFPPQRTAVIYDKRMELEELIDRYKMQKNFRICRTVHVRECLADPGMLDDVETVFLEGIHSHDRNAILKYCMAEGIDVYVIPRIGDTIMSGAKQTHMFHLPILRVEWCRPQVEYLVMKRTMDIIFSVVALLVTSPVMLVTAAAIRAEDGGPVFYRQTRLTKDGREFSLIKFRSMRVDAEKDGVARLSAGEADPRVTAVGRILRRYRIDELPQFFNVLAGDMTLVGPRPERPEIARKYTEEIPAFALRLKARAGLTGYAQVYGKYNTQPYDKLQMDLMYLAHMGVIEDLRIIFLTLKVLFMKESTEGVEE